MGRGLKDLGLKEREDDSYFMDTANMASLRRIQTSPCGLSSFELGNDSDYEDFEPIPEALDRSRDSETTLHAAKITAGFTTMDQVPNAMDSSQRASLGRNQLGGSMRKIHSSPALSRPREQKLASKAEASRLSRRRKKEYLASLEQKAEELRNQLHELEQLSKGSALVESNQHAKYDSRSELESASLCLSNIQQGLLPEADLKFAMWGLGQTDGSDSHRPPGLWHAVLAQELGLTESQFGDLRHKTLPFSMSVVSSLNTCELSVKELSSAVYALLAGRGKKHYLALTKFAMKPPAN